MPEPASEAELYQLEPGQFTAARNALAKQLKAAGQGDDAARVGKLRKPPVTAWALNQLARHQPDLIGAVLETGDRLRAAMQQAVDGDASDLRDAQSAQRRAVDAAVAAAAKRLEASGHPGSETARQRMGATISAAIVDEDVAKELRNGVLDGDRSAPGFGLDVLTLGGAAPPRAAAAASASAREQVPSGPDGGGRDGRGGQGRQGGGQDRPSKPKLEPAERERRRQARARHAELEAEANRLAHKADRLATRAEDAERQAADARALADATRAEADAARDAAEAARPEGVSDR